jgi:GMP synthase-like glutamine amidotransferase
MENVLVFQHEPDYGPGLFAEVLEQSKAKFRTVHLFHDEVPTEDWSEIKALVILGGSFNINDEERYPFLRWEKTIIRTALKAGIPLWGISLGAELIAAAAGAEVYQGNIKEIGWLPVSITVEGQVDSIVGYLPERPMVFQWHTSGFELPKGATKLAYSSHYDTQAFRIGKNAYGLQFHLEVTPAIVERWLDDRSKELAQIPYVSPDKIRVDTRTYAKTLKNYGEKLFSHFIRRAVSAASSFLISVGLF